MKGPQIKWTCKQINQLDQLKLLSTRRVYSSCKLLDMFTNYIFENTVQLVTTIRCRLQQVAKSVLVYSSSCRHVDNLVRLWKTRKHHRWEILLHPVGIDCRLVTFAGSKAQFSGSARTRNIFHAYAGIDDSKTGGIDAYTGDTAICLQNLNIAIKCSSVCVYQQFQHN